MMSSLTIGNILDGLAGKSPRIEQEDPTDLELNPPGVAPFSPIPEQQIEELKNLLSYEAWLYYKQADELSIKYDRQAGSFDAHNHRVRLYATIATDLRHLPLTAPVFWARIRWLQRRVLSVSNNKGARPYYELVAETAVEQARKHAAELALSSMLPEAEQAALLRERWGELSPKQIAALEQQANSDRRHAVVIAPRTKWSEGIYHPAFGAWFVKELLSRPLPEIEAYLTVEWRLATLEEFPRLGDTRQVVLLNQVSYLLDILKAAENEASKPEKSKLKRTKRWFKHLLSQHHPLNVITSEREEVKPNLSLRQIALMRFYQNKPIRIYDVAKALAEENGHSSAERLIKLYRRISKTTGITGVEGSEIEHMISDLLIVRQHLDKEQITKLDIHLRTLQRNNLRTSPD